MKMLIKQIFRKKILARGFQKVGEIKINFVVRPPKCNRVQDSMGGLVSVVKQIKLTLARAQAWKADDTGKMLSYE